MSPCKGEYKLSELLFLSPFTLQWLNNQKLVESLVSLIDPEIDEDVSTLAGLNYCCSSFVT